jgi:uncharacterized membrane protein
LLIKYGNKNIARITIIATIPAILRNIKKAFVGSLVAFQLSNISHILFGYTAFNNPVKNIKLAIIIGIIVSPFGIKFFSLRFITEQP